MEKMRIRKNRNQAKDEEESILRCVNSLRHACQCRDVNCRQEGCLKMKSVISHTRTCRQRMEFVCPLCKVLVHLCNYHAERCNLELQNCPMPFCLKIRQKAHHMECWERSRAERLVQRRMDKLRATESSSSHAAESSSSHAAESSSSHAAESSSSHAAESEYSSSHAASNTDNDHATQQQRIPGQMQQQQQTNPPPNPEGHMDPGKANKKRPRKMPPVLGSQAHWRIPGQVQQQRQMNPPQNPSIQQHQLQDMFGLMRRTSTQIERERIYAYLGKKPRLADEFFQIDDAGGAQQKQNPAMTNQLNKQDAPGTSQPVQKRSQRQQQNQQRTGRRMDKQMFV